MPINNNFSRRDFIALAGSSSLAAIGLRDAMSRTVLGSNDMALYVGSYTTDTKSEGIYIFDFNNFTGKLGLRRSIKNVKDPSFLTIDRKSTFLYAVNELTEYEGKASGAVSAFAIEPRSGDLKFLNMQPSLGGAPCNITISQNGRFVLVANYLGGNVSAFPVAGDGKLGPSIDLVQHVGSGPNKDRQLAPHAHSITLDRRNRFAFAADLGIDRIMIYRFDSRTGKLTPNAAQPFFQTKAGSGPRHFAFHPNDKLAFVINELDSSITAMSYDNRDGLLKEIQTISTLAPGFTGTSACADIHISPDGKFLFGSNRGEDSIAAFRIDEKTGKLEHLENTSTGGKRPRNFTIDPTGSFLLAANQDTGNIVVFRIDKRSGKLDRVENTVEVPSPVCLKLIPTTV